MTVLAVHINFAEEFDLWQESVAGTHILEGVQDFFVFAVFLEGKLVAGKPQNYEPFFGVFVHELVHLLREPSLLGD